MTASRPCVGYVRVSTERQAGEVYTSLADQRAAIERLAATAGVVVQRWYADEGASGASVHKRPAFRALLADCAAAPVRDRRGLVLCLNDSRFGRFPNPDEAGHWRWVLEQAGWVVRYVENDQEGASTTARHLMRAIGDAQATEYRENLRRNARRGRQGTAEQGFWGGRAPYGYRRMVVYPPGRERVLENGVRKATDEKVRLVPEAGEADVVREAFARYATGTQSLGDVGRFLAQHAPHRKWHQANVGLLLKNPAYAGDVVGGRRMVADEPGRYVGRHRNEANAYGKRDAHEAIVDRAAFAAVQDRLRRNRELTRAAAGPYVLTGIVTCAVCGAPFRGAGRSAAVGRDGQPRYFYACRGGEGVYAVCPGKRATVTRHRLEGAVLDVLTRELSRPQAKRAIVAAIDRALTSAASSVTPVQQRRADRERAKLEAKRARVVAAIAAGAVTVDEAAPQLAEIRTALAALDQAREDWRFSAERSRALGAERDRLVALALDFPAVARRLSGPALREVIRPWLKAATFDKHTRMLTLTIRRLPVLAVMDSKHLPDQATQDRTPVAVRRVLLAAGRTGWVEVAP